MLRQSPSTNNNGVSLPHQTATTIAANERLLHSKKRLQRILQRGQIFLCLSFALLTFVFNMAFFATISGGKNEIHSNVSDAPEFNLDYENSIRRSYRHKVRRKGRWKKSDENMQLYHHVRYHDYSYNVDDRKSDSAVDMNIDAFYPEAMLRRKDNDNMMRSSYTQNSINDHRTQSWPLQHHPRVICFHINDCNDLPSLRRNSRHSIPVIDPRQSVYYDREYNNDDKDLTANDTNERSCRQSRSIESRTTIHPTCNDIHSLGFDDQMFQNDCTTCTCESQKQLAD